MPLVGMEGPSPSVWLLGLFSRFLGFRPVLVAKDGTKTLAYAVQDSTTELHPSLGPVLLLTTASDHLCFEVQFLLVVSGFFIIVTIK